MAVRFVIGKAGTGKTHTLRERLVAAVRPDPLAAKVLYLVPKQTTFTTQRAVATDPRLNGYAGGVRIIAPDDLAELALVETGRPAGARLDATGRALLIGHLLRESHADLEHFGRSAGRPGLASEIDAAFGEFERAGKSAAELGDAAQQAGDADTAAQRLGRKLRDLAKLYASYQRFLETHQFDPFARQQSAPEAISLWPAARDALVIVDEFYDFTVYERQVLVALAGVAREMLIALPFDPASPLLAEPALNPDELGLFRRTEETFRRLHFALASAKVPIDPPLRLTKPMRWKSPALSNVARSFENPPPKPVPANDDVRLCLAADSRDELERAAREVKRLLFQGYRLHDVCVLMRSADAYAAHVEAAFTEHAIPYFLDRRRPAAHHPLVRTVQAIGQIVQTRWSHDGVFDLLKAGLTGVAPADVDLLADYVTQHRLTSSAWARPDAWRYNRLDEDENRRLFGDAEIRAVNDVAALVRTAVGPLTIGVDEPMPIGERVSDLITTMERLKLRDAVKRRVAVFEEAGEIERRDEELQVWSRFTDLCDRLHELLGDVPATGTDFFKLLQTALDSLDLAVVPPTLDQVLVGSVDRTRVGSPKAVILVGLNECDFPLCQQERAILNDADRVRLLQLGLEVEPATRVALLMEKFLGYVALTRASEKLVLIRTQCDRHGQACAPSPFWKQVQGVLAEEKEQPITSGLDHIVTPHQAVTHLITWARHQHTAVTTDADASLYDWLAGTTAERVSKIRDAAWPALRDRNHAALSKEVAAQLFASPLESSVSRFESFAACPFQHFARYGLRLQRPTTPEFTAMDLGNLYHAVLDDMVAGTIRQKLDFAKAGQFTHDDVRTISRPLAERIGDQLFLSDARSRFTLDQLDRTVAKLLRAQQATAGVGRMRPAATELPFGRSDNDRSLPAVEFDTPRGHRVTLRGKIDRVDTDAERSAFSVVDYKLTGEALDYAYVAHGLMLQLLTYLLVLREHGPKLFDGHDLPPAAALYVKVLRGLQRVDHPSDAPEPDTETFLLKDKPRGVVAKSRATAIDPTIADKGQSKVLAYKLKKDGDFYASGNDGVDDVVLADLIEYVRRQVAALADRIISGEVAVEPYLIGKASACQTCDLRRVCRFDRSINHYKALPALGRQEAIDAIRNPKGSRA